MVCKNGGIYGFLGAWWVLINMVPRKQEVLPSATFWIINTSYQELPFGSGDYPQAVGHRCRPFSPPRYVPSIFIAHRAQHSHCSSVFIECS